MKAKILNALNNLEQACFDINADHRDTVERFEEERYNLIINLRQAIQSSTPSYEELFTRIDETKREDGSPGMDEEAFYSGAKWAIEYESDGKTEKLTEAQASQLNEQEKRN